MLEVNQQLKTALSDKLLIKRENEKQRRDQKLLDRIVAEAVENAERQLSEKFQALEKMHRAVKRKLEDEVSRLKADWQNEKDGNQFLMFRAYQRWLRRQMVSRGFA